MAQLVEHIVHIDGVTGSSPVATTKIPGRKTWDTFFLLPILPRGMIPVKDRNWGTWMAAIKDTDIARTMERYLEESYGYTYLPEGNVEAAKKAIASKYPNVLAYIKESKTGIKTFKVDNVTAKRLTKLYEVTVR